MLEKAEAEFADLITKRKVIEADKTKIEKVIAELDQKKNQALQVCPRQQRVGVHVNIRTYRAWRPERTQYQAWWWPSTTRVSASRLHSPATPRS